MKKIACTLCFLFLAGAVSARSFSQPGYIDDIAGVGGKSGFNGDNWDSLKTKLASPMGLAMSPWGDLYIADTKNHRIRRVAMRTGQVSTVAGTGVAGFSNDGGHANMSQLNYPTGIIFDRYGNLYIADTGNHRIRVVTLKGYLRTVAGDGRRGYNGEGGSAISSPLNMPSDVAIDSDGELYIADAGNNRIRKIENTTGHLVTVAGNGQAGNDGDLNLAVNAKLNKPTSIYIDKLDNLFIADTENHQVRWVDPARNFIFTIVGTGKPGFSGEKDRKSTDSQLNEPTSLAMDKLGRLYIADTNNHRIRRLIVNSFVDNKLETIVGTGNRNYKGDGVYAWDADLAYPGEMIVDGDALYFVDVGNNKVRRVEGLSQVTPPEPHTSFGKTVADKDNRSFLEVLFGFNW